MREPTIQYITDKKGRKKSVVLSVAQYEELIERIEDYEATIQYEKAKLDPESIVSVSLDKFLKNVGVKKDVQR